MNVSNKRDRPAKKIGGGSLPLATASSPAAAVSSATPSNGGHPASQGSNDRLDSRTPFGSRNAPGKKRQTAMTIQEWPIVKIDEISERIAIGPFGSRMKADTYTDSGVRVIRGTNISSGRVFSGDWVFISENFADELKGCNAFENDLVFPHRGAIGEVGIVPQDGRRYIISSSLMLLRCNKQLANSLYLYYFFKSEKGKHELLKNASQVGTPGIGQPLASLRSIEFPLPPINTQKKISQILSSLDDKIEANRRINQTLEAMAQALFQSWFVDFDPVKAKQKILGAGGTAREAELAAMQIISGKNSHQLKTFQQTQPQQYAELEHTAKLFPNRLVESELGLVPEGWENTSIYELCDVVYGAPFKSNLFNDDAKGLPLIRIRDLSHERPGVSTDEINSKGYQVQNGNLLVGMDGEFKPYIWGGGPAWMNQRICCFRPKRGLSSGVVKCFISRQLEYFEKTATATTVIHLGKGDIDHFSYLKPNKSLLMIISNQLESIYQIVVNSKSQSFSLTDVRDSLLPKLLSGEISVENIGELQS